MNTQSKHSLKNPIDAKAKDTKSKRFNTEKTTIFQYLKEHTATASMISEATGIKQKNICRYKRDLEKSGILWEVERKLCKETGFRAWYLTTDKKLAEHLNLI